MPDIDLAALASRFLSTVGPAAVGGMQHWAIRKEAIAESLSTVRALRGDGGSPVASARRGASFGGGTYMTRIGSTAIVPVIGPLVSRMTWSYWSYDEIIRDIRMAIADPSIESILIDVDSPGGMVANVDAAAAEIRAAAAVKPVAAHVGGIGASAAYWLAAASGDVAASETSLVGSVGALIRYLDIEGIFTRLGARVVEVIAEQSPNKRLDPDSPEGKAELQAIVDRSGELFLTGLEASRRTDRATLVDQYGQGLVFTSQEAMARGMIDRIASFEETLATLADRGTGKSAGSAAARKGQEHIMAQEKTETALVAPTAVTVEGLRAEHGELIATIEKDAATAERERILGIEANALPGHEKLVAEMKADGKTSPAEAAVRILAVEKTKAADRQKGLEALDRAAAGVESAPIAGAEGKASASTPEEWRAEWAKDSKLQAEYPTAESYIATMKKETGK